ncbi:hypothetical protein [Streptomyces wuyuanensis]|uniref:hypothetical protein n=1 Tax=Streptomyces wuyuanensis TaxID=1196353 RepID=UPI0037B23810
MDGDVSGCLHRDLTDHARTTPHWVHDAAELRTQTGLLLFGALFALVDGGARGPEAEPDGPGPAGHARRHDGLCAK